MTAHKLKPLFRSLCLLTACCSGLTILSANAVADEAFVQLKSGRTVSGHVDARTDEKSLWLRSTKPSILLRSSFAWDDVRSARHAGKSLTAAEFRTLAASLKTKFDVNRFRQPQREAIAEPNEAGPQRWFLVDLRGVWPSPAVRAFQEDVPLENFVLANEGPPPAKDDPKYIPPELQIGGADAPIPLGELIHLWVKPPEDVPDNLQSIAYTWTVLPQKSFVAWPDNTRILFGAGIAKTTYIVIVTASYVFIEVDEAGKLVDVAQRAITKIITVKVGDGTVVPPGGGNGNGGDGLSGLSKQAYDWIINVNLSNTYTVDMRRIDAAKLAISFSGIATQIQNGTLTNVTDILKATKESNDKAIMTRDIWLPWFTKMSEYLQKSYSDGTIKTLKQFTDSWLAIAKGLEAAAK